VSPGEANLLEIPYSSIPSSNQLLAAFEENYNRDRIPVVISLSPLIDQFDVQATRAIVAAIMLYHDVVAVQHQQLASLSETSTRSEQNVNLDICTDLSILDGAGSVSDANPEISRVADQILRNQPINAEALKQAAAMALADPVTTATAIPGNALSDGIVQTLIIAITTTSVAPVTTAATTNAVNVTAAPGTNVGSVDAGAGSVYSSYTEAGTGDAGQATAAPNTSSAPVAVPIVLGFGGVVALFAVAFSYRSYVLNKRDVVNSGPTENSEDRNVYDLESGESMCMQQSMPFSPVNSTGNGSTSTVDPERMMSAEISVEQSVSGDYSMTFPSFVEGSDL